MRGKNRTGGLITSSAMFTKESKEEMLVGLDTSDDAAVYKIDNDKAIIHTIDFFTPVVNDPFYLDK